MSIILLLFCLQAFCLAAGFGVADSLLKHTSYRRMAVLVGPVLFPACLVLLMTVGGYRTPPAAPPALPLMLAVPFLVYTVIVIYRDRQTFLSERSGYGAAAVVLAASTAFALTSVAPDIASRSLTYIGGALSQELLNYAALASHLMGRTIDSSYAAAYSDYVTTRSGAELLLAALGGACNAPPANCVAVLIALLRSHALAAFGFLLLRATNLRIFQRPWLLYSGLALFSLSSVEVINYSVSFLSHYSVLPISILIVALLQFKKDASDLRILGLLSFLYLLVYVSYSEVVPVLLLIQGSQALALGLRARSLKLFFLSLAPPVAAALLNPLLLVRKLRYLSALAGVDAGFVVIAAPRGNVLGYLAAVLGLRYPFSP